MKSLAVFDFDHTIVDDNADTAVLALIDKSKIPKEVRALHRTDGWTAFMQGIFKFLHQNGRNQADITALIEKIPPVRGVCNLIAELSCDHDVIIISDCNSYFIDVWLRKNNLRDRISRVFTNPAQFEDGMLKISMYHLQDYCKLSTKNLCKGQIMEDFVEEQKQNGTTYHHVVYCGDGTNDFCPILRLKEGDFACVRNNFKCLELVKRAQEGKEQDDGERHLVKAKVVVWDDGDDILRAVTGREVL